MNIPESTEDNMDHEAVKAEAKTKQILKGHLEIDLANGTATFTSGGFRVLRITHLPDPVPQNVSIDIVALPALTSYTPIRVEVKHVESFQEWIDDNIEPVDELDSSGVTDEYVNKELGPE